MPLLLKTSTRNNISEACCLASAGESLPVMLTVVSLAKPLVTQSLCVVNIYKGQLYVIIRNRELFECSLLLAS